MTITLEQVKKLHDDGLYSNVKVLVSLMLSLPELRLPLKEDYQVLVKKYQLLVYYSNALYQEECYRKAEVHYLEALKLKKQLTKLKSKAAPTKYAITPEVEVKFKLFQCYSKLNDGKQALSILEGITPKQRTPKINMMLAKLYQKHGMERSAITCYKEVLRSSSVAIEAAVALLELGVPLQEVITFVNGLGTNPTEWLAQYLKGFSFNSLNKHSKAVQIYKSLETQTLKDNVSLLCTLGETYYRASDYKSAMSCYEKVRSLDKFCLTGMDIYSQILAEKDIKDKLERLAQDLTEVNDNCTESWVAMSHYCASTNQTAKAVYFAQKAHMLDITNIPALMLKASLLLFLNKHQEAIIHYREAIRLSPNQLKPYEGLIECHITSEKYKEAMNIARNAHKTIGANARTLTLCAKVCSHDPQSYEKAKIMLKKALVHDPSHLPAVYLLCDILMKQEDYENASALVSKQLTMQQTAKLYVLYGACLKELGQDSIEMYSKALRLDPNNSHALDCIQSVERDTTNDLEMSSIGLRQARNRSSMEDLDALGLETQVIE